MGFKIEKDGAVPGPRGKSAYDAWKEVYGGSVEEFFSYLKGKKGLEGEKGDVGPKGEKGETGEIGPKGEIGETGLKGEKGEKGNGGEKGEKGEKGEIGIKGNTGPKGDKGDTGDQGIQGEKGVDGKDGNRGIDGVNGIDGRNGQKGEKGEKGDNGSKGDKGEKGDKGDKGETGNTGPKGDKGEKGVDGNDGPKGDKGETGPKGDKGETIAFQVYKIYSSSNQEITQDFSPITFNSNSIEIDTPFVKSLTNNPIDFKIYKSGKYRFTFIVVTADDIDSNYIKLKIETNNDKHIFQSNLGVDVFDLTVNTTLRFFVAKYVNYEESVRLQPGQVRVIIEQIG